jgi:hypothetical protein
MQENDIPKSSIKDRLLKFIALNSTSLHQFEKKVGLSNGYMAKVESIGSPVIEKIAEVYPDLNIDWLFTGKGHMLRSQQKLEATTAPTTAQEMITSLREQINQLEALITPKDVADSLAYLHDYIIRLKRDTEGLKKKK